MPITQDKRPDPKPRKHPELWQAFLVWRELMLMRQRHNLRIKSIQAGKSNLSLGFEKNYLKRIDLDGILDEYRRIMIGAGETLGPIWTWTISFPGLGAGGLAAQFLAQIDDVGRFSNVAKLWRFAGYAVFDGQIERNKPGEVSHYSRLLKSTTRLVIKQFIMARTEPYRSIYDDEKARQRMLHPEPEKYTNAKGETKTRFSDGHIDNRAYRKTAKIWLQHVWVMWRRFEGLPVTRPYVEAVLGHADIIEPPTQGMTW